MDAAAKGKVCIVKVAATKIGMEPAQIGRGLTTLWIEPALDGRKPAPVEGCNRPRWCRISSIHMETIAKQYRCDHGRGDKLPKRQVQPDDSKSVAGRTISHDMFPSKAAWHKVMSSGRRSWVFIFSQLHFLNELK